MLFNSVQDAINEVVPVVNGGSCDADTAIARINQATRRFMNRQRKPIHIRRLVRFFTRKDIITLPHEIEHILHYTMDGAPAPMFSQAYEFVSHGVGEINCPDCIAGKYLEDLGNFYPTFFDLPSYEPKPENAGVAGPMYSAHKLIAMSTSADDQNLEIRIGGRNSKNELLGNGMGATLKITTWDNGVEGNFTYSPEALPYLLEDVRDVQTVQKPVTTGFVSLYAFNPETYQMYFLAKYHPQETAPRYRRYRITAPDCKCGSAILAWCELGYVPKTRPEEILIVQNLDALKLMVMAIEMENDRDFQLAKAYEADAYRLLAEQRASERTHDYNLMQVSQQYGYGDIQGR